MTAPKLDLQPIPAGYVLTEKIYQALKQAISATNVYDYPEAPRLDEREISQTLGVSRTPLREALARLAQEGIVRIVPRKGVFVLRKGKKDILEMITVWAALESMAARLIALHAPDEEIASLRQMFATFQGQRVQAEIDEYSETNIRFHQTLLRMSRCTLLHEMAENLLIHMGWIRMRTISEGDRANRSIIDHMQIIEALEARNAELAERLVRQHSLDLAAHVERTAYYLD